MEFVRRPGASVSSLIRILTFLCILFLISTTTGASATTVKIFESPNVTLKHNQGRRTSDGELWKTLEVVDGLKNEDVAIFLMGTGNGRFQVIRERFEV